MSLCNFWLYRGRVIQSHSKHFSFAFGGIAALGLLTAVPVSRLPDLPHTSKTSVATQIIAPSALFEIHYSPSENLEHIDVETLSQAHSTIDFAAYVLTDIPVIEALSTAAARGVAVRLYVDGSGGRPPAERTTLALDKLLASKMIEMRIKPAQSAIMHLKGYVVDGQVLRAGSANFSASGLKQQDNDLIRVNDANSVHAFEEKFQTMWEREARQNLAALPIP